MLTQAAKVCIAVTTILGSIAVAVVALRFYCRLKVQKATLGADDWCILVSLILSTGIFILTDYVAATTGVGESTFVPTLDQIIFALKTILGLENAQVLCMGLIKISLLLYYKRIFIFPLFQTIANILIGVVAAFEILIVLAVLFAKGLPISKNWDPMEPFTLNISAILIAFCAGNAVSDIITLAMPLVVVRTLHISSSKKLLLSVIFSLGSFCIIASIIRLYYAVQFTKVPATGASYFQAPFIHNSLWSLIEPPVFIVAGSLLTLGPVFRGKYGPANLLRSLRSKLLAYTGHNSSKSVSTPTRGQAEELAPYGKLPEGSEYKLWHLPLNNSTTTGDVQGSSGMDIELVSEDASVRREGSVRNGV